MLPGGRIQGKKAAFGLLFLFALVTLAQANIRFYSIVQRVCNSYRVPVVMDKMKLTAQADGDLVFDLFLESRRNNFEEVMMVGYIGAGQAIARTNLPVKRINITVSIPKADYMIIMTSSDVSLVESLRLGKVKSSEFIRQLQWN